MPVPASITTQLTPAWTLKDDTDYNWIPLTTWIAVEGWSGVRAALELANITGDLLATWALQTSNDRVNVDTPVAIGLEEDANGLYVQDGFTDVSTYTDDKLYIRFGARVKNKTAGTTLEMCRFGGKLDFK